MPTGAKLEKAHLMVVEPPSPATKPPSLRGAGKQITFQFNPREYTIRKSAKWERKSEKGAKTTAVPEFMGPDPATLDLEMFLDATEEGGDVAGSVDALFGCLAPTPKSLAANKPSPPWVVFGWGGTVPIVAIVKSVSARYTLFRPDGAPIRATCNLSLEEVPTESPRQNPTSGARTALRTHRVVAGDTLASIAYAEYEDAGLWRALAEANGLDDPMRLPTGTELLVPAAAEAAARR